MDKNIEKLHNFTIHAHGNYIVITAITPKNNTHTFLATTPILKYILCNMNQKIIIGPLSKCQLGSIFVALDSVNCGYKLVSINNQIILVSKDKEKIKKR